MSLINRGDVFYVDRHPTYYEVGSEQQAGRPAIIVSNNANNEHSRTVTVCYLTRQEKNPLPTHVEIKDGPCANSTVLCEQVSSVSIDRIGSYKCSIDGSTMSAIDKALAVALGLPQRAAPVVNVQPKPSPNDNEELNKLKYQVEFYKDQYENLMNRLVYGITK